MKLDYMVIWQANSLSFRNSSPSHAKKGTLLDHSILVQTYSHALHIVIFLHDCIRWMSTEFQVNTLIFYCWSSILCKFVSDLSVLCFQTFSSSLCVTLLHTIAVWLPLSPNLSENMYRMCRKYIFCHSYP
jgi:hypothetical protein